MAVVHKVPCRHASAEVAVGDGVDGIVKFELCLKQRDLSAGVDIMLERVRARIHGDDEQRHDAAVQQEHDAAALLLYASVRGEQAYLMPVHHGGGLDTEDDLIVKRVLQGRHDDADSSAGIAAQELAENIGHVVEFLGGGEDALPDLVADRVL